MQINTAKSAGFCFGVKRAIDIALETARKDHNVSMLGDIVHNETVVKKISEAGIKKIKKPGSGKNTALLIRAHGEPKATLARAKRLGYKIIDATCPMVKEIHRIAISLEKKGRRIIVIGDKRHDEVKGIVGQLKTKAIVIDSREDIPAGKIKGVKTAGIVVQSTQNADKVSLILGILKAHIKNIRFHNTICRPTTAKQQEIKRMPLENDVMLVIGSKKSANTKRLYEISKGINKKSYWINSRQEIKPGWFRQAKSVGITAGASTPQETIKSIINRLKNISDSP